MKERIFTLPKKACMEHIYEIIQTDSTLKIKERTEDSLIIEKVDSIVHPTSFIQAGLSFHTISKNETKIIFDTAKKGQIIPLILSGVVVLIFIGILLGSLLMPYISYILGLIDSLTFTTQMQSSLFFLLFAAMVLAFMGIMPLFKLMKSRSTMNTLFQFFMIAYEELEENFLKHPEYIDGRYD